MCLHLIAGCGDAWCFEVSEAIVVGQHGEPPELLHGFQRELTIKSHLPSAKAMPASNSSVFESPDAPSI